MENRPNLLVSTPDGEIIDIPGIEMAIMSFETATRVDATDLIELPAGSSLFRLPSRVPLGFDPREQKIVEIPVYDGVEVEAVSAFMPPAYLRLGSTAYNEKVGAPRLPLYAYSAVGWADGKFYVTGERVDPWIQHDPERFNRSEIDRRAATLLKRYPKNRLITHLVENCVRTYGCGGAKNFVMNRWECPLPVSQECNASCLGCISKQPSSSNVTASQHRLNFTPTVPELVETAVPFLKTAQKPVASFGQGCEGDPLIRADIIEQAIKEIRKQTSRGVINVNTNGGLTGAVEKLCDAGLDSIRISMNSVRKAFYTAYYSPRGYEFENVVESMKIMRRNNRWVSINYLVFPGFTDTIDELEALSTLITDTQLNMIQARNLNIDPNWYGDCLRKAGIIEKKSLGMKEWLKILRQRHPGVNIGYFNPFLDPGSTQKKMVD
jgi:molybdenum cofactor biosynthesis enzyme MoaA